MRLTKTQRDLLTAARANNGRLQCVSGSRILRWNADRTAAQVNSVTLYFLSQYGLWRGVSGQGGKLSPGTFEITQEGRIAAERGWHCPSETKLAQRQFSLLDAR